MTNLKQLTVAGLKWSAFERISSQGISFIISIIIARLLSPSDYGLIGMITIFTAISIVFINAGFPAALIRKQNRTKTDLSTVFFYNTFVSVIFYLILFFCAPLIAAFYETPILKEILRVIGLNMIIGAFGAIQTTLLDIAVDFKTQTKVSVISIFFTGTVGITLAYTGFGVWALVIQSITAAALNTSLLWYFVEWRPKWIFSVKSFKELFGFGSKLMFSGLLNTIYQNIYHVIIGKMFSTAELGYFTRAKSLAFLPSSNITSIIQRVTFPVLSQIQNDNERLATNYQKLLKMTGFIIFPLMILLFVLAQPLVKILLTEKWLPAVPLLKVLCLSYMLLPIHVINMNILQVKGRSDLYLKIEIIKKVVITIVLFATAPFGVLVMCYGILLTSIIELIINTYYTGKLIRVGFLKQIYGILPMLILSLISGFASYLPTLYFQDNWAKLISGSIAGGIIFIGISLIFKFEEFYEIKLLIVKNHK